MGTSDEEDFLLDGVAETISPSHSTKGPNRGCLRFFEDSLKSSVLDVTRPSMFVQALAKITRM
jgi:hypothetical protein